MMDLFTNVKFRRSYYNEFQNEMEEWLSNITSEKKVIVPSDKTRNYYTLSVMDYDKLLTENVTSEYTKATNQMVHDANCKAKKWVTNIGSRGKELAKRVQVHSEEQAFITLKDHKEDFRKNKTLQCRLIKPSKADLGKISKKGLEAITKIIRAKTMHNQWISTADVINWFRSIKNKRRLLFISFDIRGFYPAITEQLLMDALEWAQKYAPISAKDMELFKEARRSFLYHHNSAYVKTKDPNFDVGMGSYDGAEVCELVGLFLLEEIITANIGITKPLCGLYRDDGLACVRDRVRINPIIEDLVAIFKKHGLDLSDIRHSLKQVDFLDITLNLESSEYEPFRKKDNLPVYVHKGSNHPPSLTANIPKMIERMISDHSSTEAIFQKHKDIYSDALKRSGYDGKMKYAPKRMVMKKKKKVRWPNILYFHPPYNACIETNVGKETIKILKQCFDKTSKWYRHFNTHTIKISYSCTKNVASRIASHNAKMISGSKAKGKAGCKCRDKTSCPIPGDCKSKNIVYQALIDSEVGFFNYFGMTSMCFKDRFNNHKYDFNHPENPGTALSNQVHKLEKAKKKYSIKWSIVDRAFPYQVGSTSCDLCSTERMHIAMGSKGFHQLPKGCVMLNKRREIFAKCRHMLSHSLSRVKEEEENG